MANRRALFLGLTAVFTAGVLLGGETIPNWPAPPTWSPALSDSGGTGMTDLSGPLPFIPITPCRIADTRGLGFTGQAGPPSLNANVTRNFQISGVVPGVTAQCGIPTGANAVSFNFAVTNITANGNLIAFPAGGSPPTVSSLNWQTGFAALSNAAVIPLSVGGALGVQVNAAGGTTVDLIIDVNGYYAGAGAPGANNVFLGSTAGNSTMGGQANVAIGNFSLRSNTGGGFNTAIGTSALFSNTTGNENTGSGASALVSNTTGSFNTAVGGNALRNNTTSSNNVAVGNSALLNNAGGNNTAIGFQALRDNGGDFNAALGTTALRVNTTGFQNTAIGESALLLNTTGCRNIAIGRSAGFNLTTECDNIDIGNFGVSAESNAIHIGTGQTATFIAGISGQISPGGSGVFIDVNGKLGTSMSARRFKEDIREITEESEGLMRLRPVTFRYKREMDPTGSRQYGLIAEEVEEVLPELVTYGRDGRVETVKYHVLPTLLLNEVQRQRRTIESQRAEMEELRTRLSKLEARLLAESPQ